MTVYIEYVLIDNLVIDYLLLKTTHLVLKNDYSKIRLFLCALLGAVFALLFASVNTLLIIELLIKVLMGAILVMLSKRYKTIKGVTLSVLTFLAITFIFGGAVYAIYFALGISLGKEFSVGLCFLPVLLVYKMLKVLLNALVKNKEISTFIYDIEILKNDKKITGKGFLDSGNLTFIEGKPVVFTSFNFLQKILSVLDFSNLNRIKVLTISGEKEKYRILLDEFRVFYNGKWNIYTSVWACIVDGEILGNHDVLFGSAFLEGIDAKITA